MKCIGVLGGMSAEATSTYYGRINEEVNRRLGGWHTADLLIWSVDFAVIEECVRNHDWEWAGAYLESRAIALEEAGAELLICVSNTLHRVAGRVTRSLGIPFLHIVDPTARAARARGLDCLALIGTKPVMAETYLRQRFESQFGLTIIVPDEPDQIEIDRIIFDELVKGLIDDSSREYLVKVVDKLERRGARGVVLGCTEFPMILNQTDLPALPLFDTARLHADAAVAMAFGEI